MKQPLLKKLYPEQQFENIAFLEETCAQINKDLNGHSSKQILLTEGLLDKPLLNITKQLSAIIIDLQGKNNLQPFIYTVDLSEKKYLNYCLRHIDLDEFTVSLIERCAQKVFLRWHFSNRLNQS